MRDIHIHILPGIDDGPDDWGLSVEMLKAAKADGVEAVIATPHVSPRNYPNVRSDITKLVGELNRRAAGLGVEVYPGSELLLGPESLAGLKDGTVCTLNNGRYVLVELPSRFAVGTVVEFIYSLRRMKLVMILAHPERNPQLGRDVKVMYELVGAGALMQLTAGSLTGLFGGSVKRHSTDLLKRRLVHFISSDSHNTGQRSPALSQAFAEASKIIGADSATVLVDTNPLKVINNEPIEIEEPVVPKKKFLFF